MKIVFLLSFLLVAFLANSQSIKLKITGITGKAGEEVIAFQTGDTITVSGGIGTGSISPARFEPVKIKKQKDTSTNELFKRAIGGAVIPEVVFEFYNAEGNMYYKIVLKDVIVTHFSFLSPECSGCSKLFHQLWMDYRKIEWTDGVSETTIGYDLGSRKFY